MIYYAWAQEDYEPRFIGQVNPRTGKRSQAGSLNAFTSRKARDAFTSHTRTVAVTALEARQLLAGLDKQAFEQRVAFSLGCDL